MAYIVGANSKVYVFVDNESVDRGIEVSSHPVESGIDISDTIKRSPIGLSISGVIVDYPTKETTTKTKVSGATTSYSFKEKKVTRKAAEVLSILETMKNSGELVTYHGRNMCKNMQITSLSTDHPNTVWGGANFSMSLQECRIVSNAYVAPKDTSVKDGGNQQTDKGDNEEVWHTVKKGDCVAALVAEPKAPYKNLKREGAKTGYWGACNWVMEKNQSAFSRKGDFRTLQIGKKLLVGTR